MQNTILDAWTSVLDTYGEMLFFYPVRVGALHPVLEILPRFALKEGVVAIGEIGYDEITEAEEKAYQWQLSSPRTTTWS